VITSQNTAIYRYRGVSSDDKLSLDISCCRASLVVTWFQRLISLIASHGLSFTRVELSAVSERKTIWNRLWRPRSAKLHHPTYVRRHFRCFEHRRISQYVFLSLHVTRQKDVPLRQLFPPDFCLSTFNRLNFAFYVAPEIRYDTMYLTCSQTLVASLVYYTESNRKFKQLCNYDRICIAVSTQYTNVTDRQTPHDSIGRTCSPARLQSRVITCDKNELTVYTQHPTATLLARTDRLRNDL